MSSEVARDTRQTVVAAAAVGWDAAVEDTAKMKTPCRNGPQSPSFQAVEPTRWVDLAPMEPSLHQPPTQRRWGEHSSRSTHWNPSPSGRPPQLLARARLKQWVAVTQWTVVAFLHQCAAVVTMLGARLGQMTPSRAVSVLHGHQLLCQTTSLPLHNPSHNLLRKSGTTKTWPTKHRGPSALPKWQTGTRVNFSSLLCVSARALRPTLCHSVESSS
mmetsp:Transcript_34612/g.90648  ORF Transcript_34612/g.90648 Transcript_34612/m.90648 type:complete len:215 (+) Transcript_34612:860-1504(+)